MKLRISYVKGLTLLAVLLVGLYACSSGGDTGRLSLSLTDKPSDAYNAVYVTIQEIAIHAAGEAEGAWKTILEPNKTMDLLALANGVREQLGIVSLDPGQYTQLRLIIGTQPDNGLNIQGNPHPFANYVIDTNGDVHEMKVPSGMQTGIKLVQGFEINENSTTELTIDVDASRSVVVAGNSGKYLLKPTIQVIDTAVATVINGMVTKLADSSAVGGALVNIQVFDGTIVDPTDQIVVLNSTFTDDTDAQRGAYKFFFAVPAPTTINLVAVKEGLVPGAERFLIENGNAYTKDFALTDPTGVGTVDIGVTGATTDVPVQFSIRQTVTLDATSVDIEIKTLSVVNGDPDPFDLPAGNYKLVYWTEGKATPTPVPFTVTATQTI